MPFKAVWWNAFLGCPLSISTQILGAPGKPVLRSRSRLLLSRPDEDASSTTSEMLSLERGMLLAHQAQSTLKLQSNVIAT